MNSPSAQENITASVRRLADDIRLEVKENMRGLRAELAASAESARAQARTSHKAPSREAGGTAAVLKEAEFTLQRFRDDLRVELRLSAARSGLDDVSLATLRTVLDQAATAIKQTLRQ
ncbi:hypothetical protein [Arthrobacter psychrolactophilus]